MFTVTFIFNEIAESTILCYLLKVMSICGVQSSEGCQTLKQLSYSSSLATVQAAWNTCITQKASVTVYAGHKQGPYRVNPLIFKQTELMLLNVSHLITVLGIRKTQSLKKGTEFGFLLFGCTLHLCFVSGDFYFFCLRHYS